MIKMENNMDEITITTTKNTTETGVFQHPKRGDIINGSSIVVYFCVIDYFTHVWTYKILSKYKLIRKLQIWYYKHF